MGSEEDLTLRVAMYCSVLQSYTDKVCGHVCTCVCGHVCLCGWVVVGRCVYCKCRSCLHIRTYVHLCMTAHTSTRTLLCIWYVCTDVWLHHMMSCDVM